MKSKNSTTTNVNQSGYRIKLSSADKNHHRNSYFLGFELILPINSSLNWVVVNYSDDFISNYWKLEDWDAKVKQEITILIWWGWLKIKEEIDRGGSLNQSLRINIFLRDTNWARSVEKQIDQNICSQIEGDGYLYSPQRKMGFRP